MHGVWIFYQRMDGWMGGFWNSWKQALLSSTFGTLKPHLG
jgi:hypothetical protein